VLHPSEQAVVVSVATDPEPNDLVALEQRERTVPEADPDGVHRVPIVDPLEVQARMLRIGAEQPVGLLRGVPHVGRQSAVRRPEARGTA